MPVADPGLNFGGNGGAKVQKVPKLAKHSVKQKKTTVKCPIHPPPGSATGMRTQYRSIFQDGAYEGTV